MNENEQFETEGKPELPPLVPSVWKDHEDKPNGSHHDNADFHRSRKDQSIQLPDPPGVGRNSELKESINPPGVGRNSKLKESINPPAGVGRTSDLRESINSTGSACIYDDESAEVCVHADELNIHDVLSGRGHTVIFQSGNIYFRKLINIVRNEYVAVNNANEKKHFTKEIHDHIRSMDPPGRFLKKKSPGDPYVDIGVRLAIRKTSQALREGAPEIRKLIDSGVLKVKIVTKVSSNEYKCMKFLMPLHMSARDPDTTCIENNERRKLVLSLKRDRVKFIQQYIQRCMLPGVWPVKVQKDLKRSFQRRDEVITAASGRAVESITIIK